MKQSETDLYLFVYGTLLSTLQHPVFLQMCQYARLISPATTSGQLYLIDGYPGLITSGTAQQQVTGELYSIHDSIKLFALLDEYEGCSMRFAEPTEYIRRGVKVESNGRSVPSWTYIYNWPVTNRRLISNGDFNQYQSLLGGSCLKSSPAS